MKKSCIMHLLLSVVILPIALLWGELFVRVLLPQNVDHVLDIFQADPVVGYTYQPNAKATENGREYNVSYETNSLGLRDREYDLAATDVFRILLFGDSFSESFGLSLDKSLSKQIEHALQEELGKRGTDLKVEVVNVSFGGYSPYHYWKSYGRWESTFKPDLVLIGFYIGNDFLCEADNVHYAVDKGEIVGTFYGEGVNRQRRIGVITSSRKWLGKNSELYVLFRNFFYYNDIMGIIMKKAEAQGSTEQFEPYFVSETGTFTTKKGRCLEYLTRLGREAAYDGVAVGLIAIPQKLEIDASYFDQALNGKRFDPALIDLDRPYKTLSAFCNSTGIVLLSPRDVLKDRHGQKACYFKYDGHWNEEGVAIAAASIIQQMREQGLRPFDRPAR